MSLLQDFEQDPIRIWESNIFGKSLHELVNEGLENKLLHAPGSARPPAGNPGAGHQRGCSGLICIIPVRFHFFRKGRRVVKARRPFGDCWFDKGISGKKYKRDDCLFGQNGVK